MQYESSITSGLEDMAKVKVFVHATDADITGVKPLIVTAVTINPIWRTPKKEKSIFCFICFVVALFKILPMKE